MSEEKAADKFGFAMVPNTDSNYLLQKRNVDPLRKMLQESLSGVSYHEVKDGKQWKVVEHKIGDPRLNDKGVQRVMMFFDLLINPQTVMGNITREELGVILHDVRVNIANSLWINAVDYGLDLKHYNEVIDDIMSCVRLFLTRPIDNKERESDGQSVKVSEINNQGGSRPVKKNLMGMI